LGESPAARWKGKFERPDLGECPRCKRAGRPGHLRLFDGLTRVTAEPYEFAACDQDTRTATVCGYTAATQDGKLCMGAACPRCEMPTRPIRRRDGGHVLACDRHGWYLADETWSFVTVPACADCGNKMAHREHPEVKGQFVWFCFEDEALIPSNLFGAIGQVNRSPAWLTEKLAAKLPKGEHMGLNKHQVIGRLGRDPELQVATPSGRVWTRFWIATTETWKDGQGERHEHTEWHAVTCWGARAEVAVKYLRKGSRVYVSGPVRSRVFTIEGTGEVRRARWIQVQELVFLDDRRQENPPDLESPPADDGPAPDAGEDGENVGDQAEAA
jgi:single-strand DNA-binding protein